MMGAGYQWWGLSGFSPSALAAGAATADDDAVIAKVKYTCDGDKWIDATYETEARHQIVYDTLTVKKGDTYEVRLAPAGGVAIQMKPRR